MKILILGVSGMLGNTLYRYLSLNATGYEIFGTVRSQKAPDVLNVNNRHTILTGIDLEDSDKISQIITDICPNIIINCIGVIKQNTKENLPAIAIKINSLLPHIISEIANQINARFIHVSTDCIFSGKKGNYIETDPCDVSDLYGLTKYLGEVISPNSLTLRTSLIGHELHGHTSLLDWFLTQKGTVKGYKKAIFSGLTTLEFSKVFLKYILPRPELNGLYHLSVEPISKFDLLSLVNQIYDKKLTIEEDSKVIINRSLNSEKFKEETGYTPEGWPILLREMKMFG